MTVRQYDVKLEDNIEDYARADAGAVTNAVQLTYDDAKVTKSDIVLILERFKQRVVKDDLANT